MSSSSSASKSRKQTYLADLPRPPSQTWRRFLRNHMHCLASMDFFVLPTATFRLLFVFMLLHHERRRIVHFGVTAHPAATWIKQQITEAFPWDTAPRYADPWHRGGALPDEHHGAGARAGRGRRRTGLDVTRPGAAKG